MNRFGAVLVLGIAVALGCGGSPPPSSCVQVSKNWEIIIYDFQYPEAFMDCPGKMFQSTPYTSNELAILKYDHGQNGYLGPSGHYFYYWTKQTRDAQNNVRSPFVQDEGYWSEEDVNVGESPTGNTEYEMGLPLTVVLALAPESSTKPQHDSLKAYFTANQARTTSAPFSAWDAAIILVADIVRGVTPDGDVGGVSTVPAGSTETWSHAPSAGDTLGFRYQWFVNGTPQAADTGARMTRSFSTAGTYTLRVDQTLIDTTYTYSKSVTVQLAVSISGPGEVAPYTSEQYSASASGGTAPYTYQWQFNGGGSSSGSSAYSPSFSPSSSNTVTVTATDATSKTGTATMYIYAATGCDPNDPECHIELRAQPTPAKKAAPVKRPVVPSVRRTP